MARTTAISRACATTSPAAATASRRGSNTLGFDVIPSQGTYFVNIDIAPLGETDDVAFCRRLVMEHGVAAIPVSAFYAEGAVKNVVRFCFAKKDSTLDAGWSGWRRRSSGPPENIEWPANNLDIVSLLRIS